MRKAGTWLMALACMIVTATGAKAQSDSTAEHAPRGNSPMSQPHRSGSVTVFAGLQRGLTTKQEQVPQDTRPLVGAALNFPVGAAWELSPEASLWRLKLNAKEQWNVKLALPLHWRAPIPGPLSVYALSGPAMLFGGWFFLTLDAGGGLSWMITPGLTFSGEVRTSLYYHTSGVHSPMVLTSPASFLLGVRLTPPSK